MTTTKRNLKEKIKIEIIPDLMILMINDVCYQDVPGFQAGLAQDMQMTANNCRFVFVQVQMDQLLKDKKGKVTFNHIKKSSSLISRGGGHEEKFIFIF